MISSIFSGRMVFRLILERGFRLDKLTDTFPFVDSGAHFGEIVIRILEPGTHRLRSSHGKTASVPISIIEEDSWSGALTGSSAICCAAVIAAGLRPLRMSRAASWRTSAGLYARDDVQAFRFGSLI